MTDEITLLYSIPLDSEGFLRRQCPTCERECKWMHSETKGGADPAPEGGYYCPYCAIQAPPGSWFTKAQIELARGTVMAEAVGPEMEKLGDAIKDMARHSGGLLEVRGGNYRRPSMPDPLTESDDMLRVDFTCHPAEPVKVLDEWTGEVHCLICGGLSVH